MGGRATDGREEFGVPDRRFADTASGSSRRRFLAHGVFGVGAVATAAAVVAARATSAGSARTAAQDTRILNFLLLLEYVQERFYAAAESAGALGGELAAFARTVREHERLHLDALRRELGTEARQAPKVDVGATVTSEAAFSTAALALEETVSAAYIGQAANLTTERIPVVARIVPVEARHAAWIRDIAGRLPAPWAADPPKTADQVINTLKRIGLVIES